MSITKLNAITLILSASVSAQVSGSLGAAKLMNCENDLQIISTVSQFCVAVNVHDGYFSAVPGSAHIRLLDNFWPSKPPDSEIAQRTASIEAKLIAYLTTAAKAKRIYTFGIRSGTQASPPDAAIHLEAASLSDALVRLKQLWPDCDQCDGIIDRATGDLATTLLDTSPLSSQLVASDPSSEPVDSSLAYSLDALLTAAELTSGDVSVTPITVNFDLGSTPLANEGRLKRQKDVLDWLKRNVQDRFWIEKEIRDYFTVWYTNLELSPTVIVSGAGQGRSIVVKEADRLGRLLLPAQDNISAQITLSSGTCVRAQLNVVVSGQQLAITAMFGVSTNCSSGHSLVGAKTLAAE